MRSDRSSRPSPPRAPRAPLALPAARPVRRAGRRRPAEDGILSEVLDAPVPGSLLVLLSRLHRSERPAAERAED